MAIHTRYTFGDQNDSAREGQHGQVMNGDHNNEGVLNEEQLEQYRLMAQIEANVRVRDNTGYDREEYERQLDPNHSRIRPRPVSFFATADPRPTPLLPESRILPNQQRNLSNSIGSSRMGSGSMNGSIGSSSMSRSMSGLEAAAMASTAAALRTSSSSMGERPKEPDLPPRRANRRLVEHPRPPEVDEICDGVVVQLADGTPVNTTTVMEESEEEVKREEAEELEQQQQQRQQVDANDPNQVVVDCWGCGCRLRAHRLASLVKCSKCLTVSPSIHHNKGRR